MRRATAFPLGISEDGLLVGFDPVDGVVFPLGDKIDGRRRVIGVPGHVATHGVLLVREIICPASSASCASW